MQYFSPDGAFFVGDCMPFYHDGVFHLFYLLDEGHHRGNNGLGGHVWAHATTKDLIRWEHHPLALPRTEDWEESICTGSVFFHDGVYHAFYAIRKSDFSQHLGHAVSADGITFSKLTPAPFASAPEGYSPQDFRDPTVICDGAGRFHMLVTSRIADFPLHDRGGCLLRMTSEDLTTWSLAERFLVPDGGSGYRGIPECPDWFGWNGWHYLTFGLGLQTHYRMSRGPFGPWERPPSDTLGNRMLAVAKTASFGRERRIAVGWIGSREDDRDTGDMLWGGNAVFRELVQHDDGTLGTRFPAEMLPGNAARLEASLQALTSGVSGGGRCVHITAPESREVGEMPGLPTDYHLRVKVRPEKGAGRYGLGLRGSGKYAEKYDLLFQVPENRVSLAGEALECVEGLDRALGLEVVLKDDIIDVCIDGRRCLINRQPELKGGSLFFFGECGTVTFEDVQITPLAPEP